MNLDFIDRIADLHVVVVGDIMLDGYQWGAVERISPEAPVPIVHLKKTEYRLGGAANVALNCRALGARVSLAGIVGDDTDGKNVIHLVHEHEIDGQLIFTVKDRPTTVKTRIISKNQQLLRLDAEDKTPLAIPQEHAFIDTILRFLQIQKPDVLIFEDYNKGLLKPNVIQRIIEHCKVVGITTAVDPKKDNFLAYKGVDLFKPNLKEVREGLELELEDLSIEALKKVHNLLLEKLSHQVSLITLSEHGLFYQEGENTDILPSEVRSLADVSGAGDTVIAVAAMIYATTKDVAMMAKVANTAAGFTCEEVGVAPIKQEKLWAAVRQYSIDDESQDLFV